ncbi:unnamed protein product [Euphydryas editha]|uniref:Transposase n=1 Tax=Euphydryas editha TaxID=104508 RepID=A0AAU9TSM0_EUPED|nr:unnamed protein product [Euphydryas editha]
MDEFLRRFVTVDETWIHHNTPETKQQTKQWVSRGESAPKKAKVGLPANKVMATIFSDARDLAPSDYFLFPNLKKWLGGKRVDSNKLKGDYVEK